MSRLKDLTRDLHGRYVLTVEMDGDPRQLWDALHDSEVDITIRKHRERRSLDANAFCWALCSDIGKALKPPVPKEEIYRNAIKGLGKYDMVLIKAERAGDFKDAWGKNGVGWFAEDAGESKEHPGYVWLFAYAGTSSYNSKDMNTLLSGLVADAEQMGIQIPLGKNEIERLKNTWHRKGI